MSDYENIRLEVKDFIATVTMDRPPVNALSMGLYKDIARVFQDISDRIEDVRVAIFTGTGKYFCAGRDLKVADADPPEKRSAAVKAAFHAVHHCAVPVVGAVNGPALGGGFTAAAVCDIIIASENAVFGLPEINAGLCGGFTSTRRGLNQYQGRLLYFTGERVPAQEFYRMGMVYKVVPQEALMTEAMKLARVLAGKSPLALRAAKWSANEVEVLNDFEYAYRAVESRVSLTLVNTEDHKEAVRAFVEKRAPVFKGR